MPPTTPGMSLPSQENGNGTAPVEEEVAPNVMFLQKNVARSPLPPPVAGVARSSSPSLVTRSYTHGVDDKGLPSSASVLPPSTDAIRNNPVSSRSPTSTALPPTAKTLPRNRRVLRVVKDEGWITLYITEDVKTKQVGYTAEIMPNVVPPIGHNAFARFSALHSNMVRANTAEWPASDSIWRNWMCD
ncbi:hypothetical protein FOZ61_010631, partial [Perkinsus olseni]